MTVIPFSSILKSQSWSDHSESEGTRFIQDLLSGKGSKEDYLALVEQHYFIYQALESAAKVMESDPVAAKFITSKLTRLPALEADLAYLKGENWESEITPLPTTKLYVRRIRTAATQWVGYFIAHHYTRYLGDLSGGQMIRKILQRHYGFETNGIGFYLFAEIANPNEFKEYYRSQLDCVGWSEEEQQKVIAEVSLAYKFNTDLFCDLAKARKDSVA